MNFCLSRTEGFRRGGGRAASRRRPDGGASRPAGGPGPLPQHCPPQTEDGDQAGRQ